MVFTLQTLIKVKELAWYLKYRHFDITFPEQFYKSETNCTCTVPCERVVYEPKLSYAQLSHLNVHRLVAGSESQQEKLSSESSHQQNGAIAGSEEQLDKIKVNKSLS